MSRSNGATKRWKTWVSLTGFYLFSSSSCLPDNFYADLAGGLITVGAELIVSDTLSNALAGSETE